jgi:hypothetical protein
VTENILPAIALFSIVIKWSTLHKYKVNHIGLGEILQFAPVGQVPWVHIHTNNKSLTYGHNKFDIFKRF